MSRLDKLKRDNLLVDIIFQHKGKENAISMKELATALGEKVTRQKSITYILW